MAQTFGQAAQTALDQATSQSQSSKDLSGSTSHKRAFLEQFRRWEAMFVRKDGRTVEAEKWLIAEYYASLKHLSPAGFAKLTEALREHCTFFPSIAECLKHTRPADRFDYSHPFHGAERSGLFIASQPDVRRLASDERKLLA